MDILYGDVNPAGRLPFTVAKNRSDYGVDLMYIPNNLNAPHQNFTNSLLIDYRYFDAKNITPRYEFGFGLSYTNFTYSDLRIRKVNAGPYIPYSCMTLPATQMRRWETRPTIPSPKDPIG